MVYNLGGTNSSKEETPTKTEHEITQQMEPAEDSDSVEKQLKVQMQTYGTIGQRLTEGKQHPEQQWKTKEDEDITENQAFCQRSSSMCDMLNTFYKVAENNLLNSKIYYFKNRLANLHDPHNALVDYIIISCKHLPKKYTTS